MTSQPGAIPFSEFMAAALYDSGTGFYSRGGRAGRRGDFLTSPEVGPLFGALVARRLDREWQALGRPDRFAVVEVGAGPGTLARAVAHAAPECAAALRYVLVDVSAPQRALHRDHLDGWVGELEGGALDGFVTSHGVGPRFATAAEMPSSITGVVIANELLDNLPFDIVMVDAEGATRRMVVIERGGVPVLADDDVDLPDEIVGLLRPVPTGTPVPWQQAARRWVRAALDRIERGALVVLDYGATTADLAGRERLAWLRTYVGHERGADPLADPGSRDITADVAIDQLALDVEPTVVTTQRDWLIDLGIEELVDEGRRIWRERATAPDVDALRARSRIGEAEALLEPQGLGRFVVLEWHVGTADAEGVDR